MVKVRNMKNIDNFSDIVEYMSRFTNLEKNLNHANTRNYRLDRMNSLLDHFNHPENNFKSIHVAGSKGKGSTSKFIAMGLKSQGFKVGLYASPHLIDYRERFTLCGDFFDDKFLVKIGSYMIENLKSFKFSDEWGETDPTTFELFTLYGFLLFSFAKCDWAVIETGLGGRLDATNTITPKASVICPIELEHTKILGSTIERIATEKSKIIKKGVPSFIATMRKEAKDVMINEATLQNSTLHIVENFLIYINSHTSIEGEKVHYIWKDGRDENLTLKIRGRVMANNCALALLTLRTLGFDDERVLKAVQEATLDGRFQTLSRNPALIIDGAHTPVSIASAIDTIDQLFPKNKITVIFGLVEDKDYIHIIKELLKYFDKFIISKPGTFKKSNPTLIYETFMSEKNEDQQVFLIEDADLAINKAYSITDKNGAILCCGSFYLASEIAKAMKSQESKLCL
jgi:dihydrofolate synthase/folylpolyglutamate synthase